ncbi:MAG: hypothetical protein WCR52_07655 [Bacteroidota bacterium]
MEPVKINLYISYAPEDRQELEKLLEWLYPMQDEVNIWFYDPPPPDDPLTLPWQLLLFWYRQPDHLEDYNRIVQERLERAHIYLFITSYRSLISSSVEYEITRAVQRYVEIGDRYLRIFPVIFRPSQWKDKSRLAHFKPLGPGKPLLSIHPKEEGFMALSEELNKVIAVLKRNLNEYRQMSASSAVTTQSAAPDFGYDPDSIEFEPKAGVSPPEWLGWVILAGLLIYTLYAIRPHAPAGANTRFKNVEPPSARPVEYPRENPLAPPTETAPFPALEDTTPAHRHRH